MKLAKTLALAGATVALAVPTAATAAETTTPKENASKACKALKAADAAAFKLLYKNHGKCVSTWTKKAEAAQSNAAKECKAERTQLGEEAFAQKYGTGKTKRNAYGKCVSGKAKAQVAEQTEQTENAAKACKRERKDAEAFAKAYGTKRNAFGKCVSSKVKAQQD